MPSGRVSARRAYPGRRERGEPGNLPLLAGRPGSTRWTRASMASAKGGQRDAVANFPHDPRPVTTPSRSPASIRRPATPSLTRIRRCSNHRQWRSRSSSALASEPRPPATPASGTRRVRSIRSPTNCRSAPLRSRERDPRRAGRKGLRPA